MNDIELCRYCADPIALTECKVQAHWERRLKACNLPRANSMDKPAQVQMRVDGVKLERLVPLTGELEELIAPAEQCVSESGIDPKIAAFMRQEIRDVSRHIYRAPKRRPVSSPVTGINKGAIRDRHYEREMGMVSVDRSVNPTKTYENYVTFHNSVMLSDSPPALSEERWAAFTTRSDGGLE